MAKPKLKGIAINKAIAEVTTVPHNGAAAPKICVTGFHVLSYKNAPLETDPEDDVNQDCDGFGKPSRRIVRKLAESYVRCQDSMGVKTKSVLCPWSPIFFTLGI